MNPRPPRTGILKHVLFWVHVLLWAPLILGLLLLLAFGEIGLVVCLLLYLMGGILARTMLLREYSRSRRSGLGSRIYADRNLLFGIDAAAGSTLMLGIVLEVGARSYGHVYGQLGLILLVAACILWGASLVWAVISYSDTRDRLILVIALTFTWVSLIGAYGVLMAPAGFWTP